MKTKILIILAFTALIACQAHAQYRMVAGKVYSLNDPIWTKFNCSLEVIKIYGSDLICRPFTYATSSQTVINPYLGGRRATVLAETHRVYEPTPPFALRNHGLQAVGDTISPGIKAIPLAHIKVTNFSRTGGLIDAPNVTYGEYPLYDMGVVYIPSQRQLTADEIKELEVKKFKELEKAAKSGSAIAAYNLGECYLAGKGCDVNTNEAIHWFLESFTAKEGNAKALKRYQELTKPN